MKKLFLRNIKKGFATNSSSYHSTLIMTDEEKEKWEQGEIQIDGYWHRDLNPEDDYNDDGMYVYVESSSTRTLSDGTVIHAITYCQTND